MRSLIKHVLLMSESPLALVSPAEGALDPAYTLRAYSGETISVSGGNGTYGFSATGLPTGMSIHASTGVISGTPTQYGSFASVQITVTSAGVDDLVLDYTLAVDVIEYTETNLQAAIELGLSPAWEDNGTDAAEDADPLYRWDDLINSYHQIQATLTNRPAYDSAVGVDYDGSDNYMSGSGVSTFLTGKAAFTLYLPLELTGAMATSEYIWSVGNASNIIPRIRLLKTSTEKYQIAVTDDASSTAATNSSVDVSLNTPILITIKGTATTVTVYENGTEICAFTYPAGTVTLDLEGVGASMKAVPSTFCSLTQFGKYVYSSAHDDTTRNAIEAEIMEKYGIS